MFKKSSDLSQRWAWHLRRKPDQQTLGSLGRPLLLHCAAVQASEQQHRHRLQRHRARQVRHRTQRCFSDAPLLRRSPLRRSRRHHPSALHAGRARPERLSADQARSRRHLFRQRDADLSARIEYVSGHEWIRLRRRVGLYSGVDVHNRRVRS